MGCLLCPSKWLQVSWWVNPACCGWRGDASLMGRWGKNSAEDGLEKGPLSPCCCGSFLPPPSINGPYPACLGMGHETPATCWALKVPTGGMLCSHHSKLHPSLGETPLGVHGTHQQAMVDTAFPIKKIALSSLEQCPPGHILMRLIPGSLQVLPCVPHRLHNKYAKAAS